MVPDPPWSSPECYNTRGGWEATGAWVFGSDPAPPILDGSVSRTSDNSGIWFTRIEGRVLTDTYRGWKDPVRSEGYGLVLTDASVDGKPSSDVAILFVHTPGLTCPLVDLRGQRVSLESYERGPWEDVYEDGGSWAGALRNAEGQLLWATLAGSLLEHSAEAVPELRTTQLPSSSAVKRSPCEAKDHKSKTTYEKQTARVKLSSLSESKVFDEQHQAWWISIGCVEYFAGMTVRDVVSSQGCYRSQYLFQLHVIRRALLSPSCAP